MFIPDHRRRLVEQFHTARQHTHAQSLNVHMKDVSGSLVNVQLFISCVVDLDDHPGYVVGIVELCVNLAHDMNANSNSSPANDCTPAAAVNATTQALETG